MNPFFTRNNKGAIALTSMIILGAVITLIIVTIVLLGISSRFNTTRLSSHEFAFIKTEGCLEEALIQLNRDNAYVGDNYVIDDLSCAVTVSGTTVDVAASLDEFHHDFTVEVNLDPFAIIDFSY